MGIFERAVTREAVDEALKKLPDGQDPRTNPVISKALKQAYEPVVKENKEWDDKEFQKKIKATGGDKKRIYELWYERMEDIKLQINNLEHHKGGVGDAAKEYGAWQKIAWLVSEKKKEYDWVSKQFHKAFREYEKEEERKKREAKK